MLLTNIRDTKRVLTWYCIAGNVRITQKGNLKGYGTVWYQPGGIANILSLTISEGVQGHIQQYYEGWICHTQS